MAYFNTKDAHLTDEQLRCVHYDDDGNELFEVEKILEKKYDSKERIWKYLVKWKNWSDENNTWEPLENLTMVQDIVDDFENTFRSKKKSSKNSKSKAVTEKMVEETKHVPETETSTAQSETPKSVEPIKDTKIPKSTTQIPALTQAQTPTSTSTKEKDNDKASEQKGMNEELPLTDTYSIPIKKKNKEETIDPRQRKKEAALTAGKEAKDNTVEGSSIGKNDFNLRPPFGGMKMWTEGQNGFHEDTSLQRRLSQETRGEIPGFGDRVNKEVKSKFSDAPTPVTVAALIANKKAMGVEEPLKNHHESIIPKMSLLENVLQKEPENLMGQKQAVLPEKEPLLKTQKSGPDDAKHKSLIPPPPSSTYNPYTALPFSPAVFQDPKTAQNNTNIGQTTQNTSPIGQLFRLPVEINPSNTMIIEDGKKLPTPKMDRMSSIVDDIDKYQEEPEDISLTRLESARSDLTVPNIQRNRSDVPAPALDMKKMISEIIIDDDDDQKKDKKDSNWPRKEKGRSRSRSRSSGHSPHSRNYKGKEKDKGKYKDNKYHENDKQRYGKNKERERSRERERDWEREKEKEKEREREREREREKLKQREKDKERERERTKALQDRHKVPEKDDIMIKGKDNSGRKGTESAVIDKSKYDKYIHGGADASGRHERVEEGKTQKKRAVYKKILYSKEQPSIESEISEQNLYKTVVNGYLDKTIDRATFLELLCPQGNFKDDEILEIKAMSWEGKASTNPEDYYFKVVWKPSITGVQKGCRYVSWQELLEEKPKEAAEFVLNKLVSIVSKYGTFGEL